MKKKIYEFHKMNPFFSMELEKDKKVVCGFSYDNFKSMDFIQDTVKDKLGKDTLCILMDISNGSNIVFGETSLFIENLINKEEMLKINYFSIRNIDVRGNSLKINLKSEESYEIFGAWNFENIGKFLQEILKNQFIEKFIDLKNEDKVSEVDIAGIIFGNVSNTSTNYGLDKFSTPRGHGFAAERANHIHDVLVGKKASIVGDDNVLNGADRIVDGVNIQSKYCKTGSKCIQECFHDGKFRYVNQDGSLMKIEVPSDKYDDAVRAMENRIKRGEVPNITDIEEAKNIVRKGNYTYEQAKNIAKSGTVESITFDSVNGAIIGGMTFGISACLTFAQAIWDGEEYDIALKKSIYSGLKVGGTTFVTAVLSSQLSRTGLNSLLVGSSEAIVKIIGPKGSALLVNAFRSGKNIYGAAAMKSAGKLLRGNVITGGISFAVLSTIDIVDIFRGRISGTQLFKNMTNTASTVVGGTAGWVGGATAGAALGSVVPVIGTAIGGFVGGLAGSIAGGMAAGKVSSETLNYFIEDDANEMIKIIEKVFSEVAINYLLNKKEVERVVDKLKDNLSGDVLKSMYASDDREKYSRDLILPKVELVIKDRQEIILPSANEMIKGLREVLEDISNEMN